MIPADVASRLQVSADATLRPVAPAQEISDKLSGLVAGQKIMAEIQALLPNGTYRALVNQRNLTLALPFSAKAGDSLELVVTESDGKLALALASRPGGEGGGTPESAKATLSQTGQLISTLYSGSKDAKGGPVTLPLNGNRPLSEAPLTASQDLAPVLKQAISQSGMFYESHQAEWIAGRLPTSALLSEPQGRLSQPATAGEDAATPPGPEGSRDTSGARPPTVIQETAPPPKEAVARLAAEANAKTVATSENSLPAPTPNPGGIVAQPLQPIVQQQLEALATQLFSWQGQVWPGQDMRWEIEEDGSRRQDEEDSAPRWSTRLHLILPSLGEIDARIRLQGDQLTLSMSAESRDTRQKIRASSTDLRSRLSELGLTLSSLGVDAEIKRAADGQG